MTDDTIVSLSSSDSRWGVLLVASTLVVLIGVLGEYVAEFTNVLNNRATAKLLERGAVLLLIIGIAGELLGEAKTLSIGDEIAAFQNRRTEELKTANLSLEAEIAPRNVSDDELKKLIGSLRPLAGRKVEVRSYLGDTEGHRLLFIVSQIILDAGLQPTPGLMAFDASPRVSLLEGMEINSPPEQKDLADALQGAFSTTKLGMRPTWYVTDAGTPVLHKIGVKPFEMPKFHP